MSNTNEVLHSLREAERHLNRALRQVGMARGKRGYVAPTVAAALESVRHAISNVDAPVVKRRSWPRLARTE